MGHTVLPSSRPLRIAVISTSYPSSEDDPSGHFVRSHVRELERAGHSVCVVTPGAAGVGGGPADAFGWPGVAARLRQRPWRALAAARWVAGARRRIARESTLDRVVCHWAVPSAWPIGEAARAPLHVVSHGGDARLLCALPPPLRGAIARRI